MNFLRIARAGRGKSRLAPIEMWKQPHGINTVMPADLIGPNEYASCQNMKLNDNGLLTTRDGLTRVTSVACSAAIKTIGYVPIGASTYVFLVDANNDIYKCTGTEPNLDPGTALSTLSGEASLVPFNGYCVVLDGSYIKTTQGVTVSLAYDKGTGTHGYQHNNLCASNDSAAAQSLYSGSITRAGSLFTTDNWGSGTIPITHVDVWLSKVGSPADDIKVRLYNSDGSSLLKTATTYKTADDLTTNATKITFEFSDSYGMSANTSYMVAVNYSSGDSSNYVKVHGHTVVSGGDMWTYISPTWTNVTTANALLGVRPGVPPKGSFGDVKDNRLFVGGDPDYPGWVWYSQAGSVFDWSTTDAGGYVGTVDDNANNYPVGGIVSHYGDLYIFGKKGQPFLSKLTGSTPSAFTLPPMFQQVYTGHKTLLSLPNDIWFANGGAVSNLSGVQEYGDLRTYSAADNIQNLLRSYYDSDAFAAYNPKDGQYIIKLSGYTNTLVCHTAHWWVDERGRRLFPWSEYNFKNLTPTAFASFNNTFYVGCSDGHLYKLDSSVLTDNGTAYDVELKGGVIEFPFGTGNVRDLYLRLACDGTASGTLTWYVNGSSSALTTTSVAAADAPVQKDLNFEGDSIQVKLDSLTFDSDVTIGSLILRVRGMLQRGQ